MRRIGIVWVMALVATLLPAGLVGAGGHGECGDTFTPIYSIQGDAPTSPLVGTTVVTEGVVSVDLQGFSEQRGFFLQDPRGDDDPATSDGIFVFRQDTSGFDVEPGQHIRIMGVVSEFSNQTQLGSISAITVCQSGVRLRPTKLDTRSFNEAPERYEGMLVEFPRSLAVTDTFNLHRFGEIWLAELGVVEQPTNEHPVGNDATAFADDNMARSVLLDDGSRFSNPSPIPYLDAEGTRRLGDTVAGLTGAVGFGFGEYRIQPQNPSDVAFTNRNHRPAAPNVGGRLVVGSANVLNYWTTLGGRGASSTSQLAVQTEKLVDQLLGMNADIIGLQEIENDPAHTPITTLVDALNAKAGTGTWAWVGAVNHYNSYPIRNEIIYRTDRVTPIGDPVALEHTAFDAIPPGRTDPVGRPPIAQTFEFGGERLTMVVNHFKSKGCGGAAGPDLDQGDGQSCFNATRVAQAEAVLGFVDSLITSSGDPDVLVVGDLNAYLDEDPILRLEEDLVNLVRKYDHDPYSFNFFARFAAPWIGRGLLDHALATSLLAKQVTRTAIWHLNADEPRFLDWFNPTVTAPGPYRASDHDPVLVGLSLNPGRGR